MKINQISSIFAVIEAAFSRETVLFLGGFLNSKKYVEHNSDWHVAPGPLLLIFKFVLPGTFLGSVQPFHLLKRPNQA